MRGRVALGLYRQMGIDECITDSRDAYVAKVIQIGRDREYREHLSRTICERSMAVLDDMQAVREFQDFLHFVAAQPERPTRPGQQRKPSEREQDEPAARPDSK